MSLSRFEHALACQHNHACPFLVLGDPTPELSVELAIAAIDAGATMLELGMPYSDPCADGPVIQAACHRASLAGVSTGAAIDVLDAIYRARPSVALNLLVYANLVHARGFDVFCADVARAGASTLLVPDVPLEESKELREACHVAGIGHVSLIAPTTSPSRLWEIDEVTNGYLYLAGHQGVTGAQVAGGEECRDSTRTQLVKKTVSQVARPIALGFGLSRPQQLRDAFVAGARIAIVGSHLVRTIESALRADCDIVPAFRSACVPLLAAAEVDARLRQTPRPY